VVIVQHPRERDVPIGTARMASLCLPSSELHVVTCVAESPSLVRALADPERPAILLSPGEGARDIARDPPRGPVTLVVVDGTWSQAKKIIKHDPALRALPRYAFVPPSPSEYRIRREPEETFVSTIEALVHTLAVLERPAHPDRFAALLAPFRAMVDFQLHHAHEHRAARIRHARAPKPPCPRLPAILLERARDLVCVVGEANAWPYSAPERERFEEELVHWTAVRVATGERFEAVLAPRHPLAPGTLRWIELDEATLRGGEDLQALAARWRAFTHPSDVIASWGTYATKLFDGTVFPLARPRVDLREAARMWCRGKVGTLDELVARIGHEPAEALAKGRAGRRLGQLAATATYFERNRPGPGPAPG
jgi:DTW domain-containing protein YfiP